MPILPVSVTVPYDKIATRERFRHLDLKRVAALNAARYPSPEDVRFIQASIGLRGNDVDGAWGPTTTAFIAQAQVNLGRDATGALDTELYQTFPTDKDDIPDAPHPPPWFAKSAASGRSGYYDLAYEPGTGSGWPRCDPQWERATMTPDGKPSWLGNMLRLLTGRAVNRRGIITYDRSPDDFITLDTYSIGVAHWWAHTAPKQILQPFTERLPDLAAQAWGERGCDALRDHKMTRAITGTAKGHRRYNPRTLSWIAAGWWWIARQPDALALQCELWAQDYIGEAVNLVRSLNLPLDQLSGAERGVVLAAIARMCNSGPALARSVLQRFWRGGHPTALVGALRDAFSVDRSKGGYSTRGNGPGRWRQAESTCNIRPSDAIMTRQWRAAVAGELACHVAGPRRSFTHT
jgi:hypothetical protein